LKILFIGNRSNVLKVLLERIDYSIDIYSLKNSYLSLYLKEEGISFFEFSLEDKNKILELVRNDQFDFCVTNGCPFILPILKSKMYNVHPTYLPYLRGKLPLNGVFYSKLDFIGATMHQISEEIDGGNIIYQKSLKLTDDIDQGLIYFLSFHLEGVVFSRGWEILLTSNFSFQGTPMNLKSGSYFNRTSDKMNIDFTLMKTIDIVRIIKSFGIQNQGAIVSGISGEVQISIISEATEIVNDYLLDLYKNKHAGEVVLIYDRKLIVKTIDGLVKVTRYE